MEVLPKETHWYSRGVGWTIPKLLKSSVSDGSGEWGKESWDIPVEESQIFNDSTDWRPENVKYYNFRDFAHILPFYQILYLLCGLRS